MREEKDIIRTLRNIIFVVVAFLGGICAYHHHGLLHFFLFEFAELQILSVRTLYTPNCITKA